MSLLGAGLLIDMLLFLTFLFGLHCMFACLTRLHPPQESAGALNLRMKHANIKVFTLHKQKTMKNTKLCLHQHDHIIIFSDCSSILQCPVRLKFFACILLDFKVFLALCLHFYHLLFHLLSQHTSNSSVIYHIHLALFTNREENRAWRLFGPQTMLIVTFRPNVRRNLNDLLGCFAYMCYSCLLKISNIEYIFNAN